MVLKTFFAIVFFTATSYAQSVIIGEPSYGGNGCPTGSLSVQTSGNGREIRLYPQLLVESGGQTQQLIDRASCNLAIPVQVPSGYQVAIASKVSGFVSLDPGARATFNQELFFAGSRADRQSQTFTGPADEAFTVRGPASLAWSDCGQDVNIRGNFSLLTQATATAGLDRIRFNIYTRRCR